jgi:hypothetical protein
VRQPVRRFLGRRIALATAALAVMLASAAISNAHASPRATTTPEAAPAAGRSASAASAVRRAAALAAQLGLPAGTASVRHVAEAFEPVTYDEVTMADARGRQVSLVRLAPDGTLALAARLGLHANGRPVDEAAAIGRARTIARQAGVGSLGRAAANASHGSGGWIVSWPRLVDGVPVRGDGVRVGLWSDGTLHSVSRAERPLAARPAFLSDAARATAAAAAFVSRRFGPNARTLTALAPTLAWVQPNDTWDASRADPAAPARIAWVIQYRAGEPLAERIAAVEMWLDAASLELVGGDVAE